MKNFIKKIYYLFTPIMLIQACTPPMSSKDIAMLAIETGSCDSFETFFHDKIQFSFQKTQELPEAQEVINEFEIALKKKLGEHTLDQEKLHEMKSNLKDLYSIILTEAEKDSSLKDLIKLEYQTHNNKELQNKYNQSLKTYTSTLKAQNNDCNPLEDENTKINEDEEEIDDGKEQKVLTFYDKLKAKTTRAQFGAIKSFAVAYQSCTAHSQEAISDSFKKVEGIVITGTHPAGGSIRVITDMNRVLRTHPYIINNRVPSSAECANPENNPKIYDFGGKPYATSDKNSTLNYFINGGSGSKELGVDCSGYVYSALMSAGLKLATNKPLRARGVYATPARAWKNLGSAMNCFKKVKAGIKYEAVQPGDIFASNRHTFIINKVGEDPLGVQKILAQGDSCNSITHKDFDFTLFQSSPTNGAIGLNHMNASYYLGISSSRSMRIGFEKFARLHCNNLKNGISQTPSISEASLVRHKMTSDCLEDEDKAIKLDHESCLERCLSE